MPRTFMGLHRGFAILLVGTVLVLLAVSAYAFVDNISQSHPDTESALTQLINGHKLTPAEQDELTKEQSHPSMVFSAESLSLAKKTLDGQIRFELPQGIQDEITDAKGNKVYDCSGGSCGVKSQYASQQVTLQFVTASSEPGSEFEFQKTVTLGQLSNSILDRAVFPVSIPVTGFPNLYPQDNYFFDVLMSFNLPDGMVRKVNGKTPTGVNKDTYAFDPGNVSESQDTAVQPLTDSKGKPVDGEFHVSFKRKTLTAWYVYSVALIPLIFALLFLHLLFFSRHFAHKVFEEFTEALIVAILAVLPLRAVLVPVELEGLTRVDLVLGLGLVLIVAVAIGKYASEIWSGSEPEAHTATQAAHAVEGAVPAPAE